MLEVESLDRDPSRVLLNHARFEKKLLQNNFTVSVANANLTRRPFFIPSLSIGPHATDTHERSTFLLTSSALIFPDTLLKRITGRFNVEGCWS